MSKFDLLEHSTLGNINTPLRNTTISSPVPNCGEQELPSKQTTRTPASPSETGSLHETVGTGYRILMADQMEMTRTSSPDGKRKRRGGPRRKTGMSCMRCVSGWTGVHLLAISPWVTCIHSMSFSATMPGLIDCSVITDVLIRMVSRLHVSC